MLFSKKMTILVALAAFAICGSVKAAAPAEEAFAGVGIYVKNFFIKIGGSVSTLTLPADSSRVIRARPAAGVDLKGSLDALVGSDYLISLAHRALMDVGFPKVACSFGCSFVHPLNDEHLTGGTVREDFVRAYQAAWLAEVNTHPAAFGLHTKPLKNLLEQRNIVACVDIVIDIVGFIPEPSASAGTKGSKDDPKGPKKPSEKGAGASAGGAGVDSGAGLVK